MPLVVLCGIPSSGKTERSRELSDYLRKNHEDIDVHVITDDITTSKDECYSSAQQEKTIRSSLKSSVERYLTPENVVILDSLNYIKGYRYELYCLSKHLQTPHCVVQCDASLDTVLEWNSNRQPSERYSDEVLRALVTRFESPDSRNRWDYPLFILYPSDPLPGEEICNALFHRKPPPPNQSTQSQPLSESNFLHELDRLTQEVVRSVINAQRTSVPGEHVPVNNTQEKLVLPRKVTIAELRKLRKQFISYTKLHPVEDQCQLVTLFVQYLNKTIV